MLPLHLPLVRCPALRSSTPVDMCGLGCAYRIVLFKYSGAKDSKYVDVGHKRNRLGAAHTLRLSQTADMSASRQFTLLRGPNALDSGGTHSNFQCQRKLIHVPQLKSYNLWYFMFRSGQYIHFALDAKMTKGVLGRGMVISHHLRNEMIMALRFKVRAATWNLFFQDDGSWARK
jgi:hypothetical protein